MFTRQRKVPSTMIVLARTVGLIVLASFAVLECLKRYLLKEMEVLAEVKL